MQGGLGASQVRWFRITGVPTHLQCAGSKRRAVECQPLSPVQERQARSAVPMEPCRGVGAPISVVGPRGLDRPAFGERVRVPCSPGVVTRSPVKPIQARNLLIGEGRK